MLPLFNSILNSHGLRWGILGIRLYVAWVFIESGWAKLQHFNAFYNAILNYQLIGPELSLIVAKALPIWEIVLGLLLGVGLFLPFAGWTAGVMTAGFILAIVSALMRGLTIDCGCFVGGKSDPISWGLVWRDLGLLALIILSQRKSVWQLDPPPSPPREGFLSSAAISH